MTQPEHIKFLAEYIKFLEDKKEDACKKMRLSHINGETGTCLVYSGIKIGLEISIQKAIELQNKTLKQLTHGKHI